MLNGLRSRVTVQCDGELKTGRDVVIAALLGAEEFGFATTALMVEGCVMMRACQKNTCPQGSATLDPEWRARYTGQPEHVINFMMFSAEEVRESLAQLGFRTLEEDVRHVECIDQTDAVRRSNYKDIDQSNVLMQPGPVPGTILHKTIEQKHELDKALDNELIAQAQPALEHGERVQIAMDIRNGNRTLGTILGYEITRRYGGGRMCSCSPALCPARSCTRRSNRTTSSTRRSTMSSSPRRSRPSSMASVGRSRWTSAT